MYHTNSTSPAFLIPFLLLLPVSGHLSRGFTVTPTLACLLCANPQALTESSPLDFRRSSIARCKGEQNYGGVALFVMTYICSVQDQMTVSATLKVTFHMLLVTHVHVTSTSMVSQVTRNTQLYRSNVSYWL